MSSSAALSPSPLILICGYMGHGKDTLFLNMHNPELPGYTIQDLPGPLGPSLREILASGRTLNRVSFADALREEAATLVGASAGFILASKEMPMSEQHRQKCPWLPSGSTYRQLLIWLATERRREDPNYWVRRAMVTMYKPECLNVVTDFRFPDEHEYLRAQLGERNLHVVRVVKRGGRIPPLSVSSEHALDDFPVQSLVCWTPQP